MPAPSLYLIKPDDFTILVADDLYARKKIRARFSYRGAPYTLSVTDPAIEKTYLMKQRGKAPALPSPARRRISALAVGNVGIIYHSLDTTMPSSWQIRGLYGKPKAAIDFGLEFPLD